MAIHYDNSTGDTKYVVSHDSNDVWHYSEVDDGMLCSTGQPNQEVFDTEAEALAIIPEEHQPEDDDIYSDVEEAIP